MSELPKKRTRLTRSSCAVPKTKAKDTTYLCGLLAEIQDLLSPLSGVETEALDAAISCFVDRYQDHQSSDESQGEDIRMADSWSDSCSEHSSDRDFIVNEDEEDEEYAPSASEEEEEYEDSQEEDESESESESESE
jgi:hypothetical protein